MQAATARAAVDECYRHCDKLRKGYLDKDELKWAVTALLGSTPTKLVLCQMFEELRATYPDVKVPRDRFISVISSRVLNIDITETLRRWFMAFDSASQGYINFESFSNACAQVVPHMRPSVVHELFREADTNSDGKVTFTDFERVMLISMTLPP
ncbi:hypothetical protein SDRG_05275 [Saprolegnia diclina VS20]|uniref:EF-hand domain-containing protein n=1 Tax=Saprolegnia diclina (strain VS20) TaxID=1156394 RepID=T0QQN8_SAPDV|nr:hypothetical protein SDRG_05275 [Saprolegnia diclina VS20]EQC37046.1 hypothetical protein SDRG_05275 [Saprolegnia diclina VS20]|eukprot:XP_008609208.1 hypothetical protein SDRG_05275 [Saprolegnia diclina VS20]